MDRRTETYASVWKGVVASTKEDNERTAKCDVLPEDAEDDNCRGERRDTEHVEGDTHVHRIKVRLNHHSNHDIQHSNQLADHRQRQEKYT